MKNNKKSFFQALLLFCIAAFISPESNAQSCDFVNDITLGHTSGRNTGYSQMYFLVNASTNVIEQISPTGANFTGIIPGFYRVIALNYNPANPPSPNPFTVTTGSVYGFLGGCFEERFYDGNSGTTVKVCGTNFCEGDAVEVGSSKFKNNAGFGQTYVLICGGLVSSFNSTGNFGNATLLMDGCTVRVLNHDASLTGLSIGAAFPAGLGGCFQVNSVTESLSVVVCPPLPLDLISFNGYPEQNFNTLNWVTGNESNMVWHIVERSPDGVRDFTEIGRKAAQNTVSATYSLNDNLPLPVGYYRIRSADVNGKEQFSNVIHILRTNDLSLLQLYPNPTHTNLHVSFLSPSVSPVKIALTDAQGKILSEQLFHPTEVYNEYILSLEKYPAGVYFIIFNDGTTREVKKIVRD